MLHLDFLGAGVFENQIKEISPEILKLRNLESLTLDEDYIKIPPVEIVAEGIEAIKDYFQQLTTISQDYPDEAKQRIMNEEEVGKATLEKVVKMDQSHPKIEASLKSEIEVFISYAWGSENEEIVNKVDRAFEAKGIIIIRDKRDAGYKASIKKFMERIGRGKAVIVVISQKYLKSPNCMFELLQIVENGQFRDRTFPIVLDDAQIYDPIDRIKYIKYWEEKIRELDEAVKGVSPRYISDIIEDVNLYDDIRRGLPKLTTVLKDMNTLTAKLHSESGFEELFKAVEQKLAE
ncbi:MAG: toll/interleukin-1 receptor domain-containing protein [Anaerolineae bacterium]